MSVRQVPLPEEIWRDGAASSIALFACSLELHSKKERPRIQADGSVKARNTRPSRFVFDCVVKSATDASSQMFTVAAEIINIAVVHHFREGRYFSGFHGQKWDPGADFSLRLGMVFFSRCRDEALKSERGREQD